MNILHNMYQTVSYAMNLVVEKNRKNHLIHRIRQIIRQEQNKANEAYIALGKYYFEHLRQPENDETEYHCKTVEHAQARIDRAFSKLDELPLSAETIYYDEDFSTACNDLSFTSCENAEEASGWDYTEMVDNALASEKVNRANAADTLNQPDFPSDEEIVNNACDIHGGCGNDYKTETTEAANDEENQIPVINEHMPHPFGNESEQ